MCHHPRAAHPSINDHMRAGLADRRLEGVPDRLGHRPTWRQPWGHQQPEVESDNELEVFSRFRVAKLQIPSRIITI